MKSKLKRGILISVEGIDGSGKSILCKSLSEKLSQKYDTILTKEPGGSLLGKDLREILQNKKVSPLSEYLLYAADRAQHFHELIIPALNQKKLIISDRMGDSSLAYQGYGRKIDLNFIKNVNMAAMQFIKPDLTIYLEIDTKTARERILKRREKLTVMEQEEVEFIENVKNAFDEIFKNSESVIKVDAKLDPESVRKQAFESVEKWLQEKNLIA